MPGTARFSLNDAYGHKFYEGRLIIMWVFVIGLVSLLASLLFGRLLAKAAAEQTSIPKAAAPRSFAPAYPPRRDVVTQMTQRRQLMMQLYLN